MDNAQWCERQEVHSNINGNSIFLPATGYLWYGDLNNAGEYGYYWSSTHTPDYSNLALGLYFYSGGANLNYSSRYNGQSVRPVLRK